MKYEEALRKAISCLKLSNSANQHEAALAAAKAQEIIDRYNLSTEDMEYGDKAKEPEENITDFSNDPLHEVCQVDTLWTLRLAYVVSELNGCRSFFHTKASGSAVVKIIGRPSDVQTVRYLFNYLESEVRRITRLECKGRSRRYQIDFRTGVVDTINHKLQQQRQQTFTEVQSEAPNAMALVRVQTSIVKIEQKVKSVDQWMKDNLKLREPKFRKQADWTARQHGQVAGEQVRFTKATGALGSDRQRLAPVVAAE